ncbi:MAG: hypothetical protein GVY36_12495 [Verrucomicrobia bacterium]|nr:hypothetical protein [Verrucomicrobiota bacterium]
MLQHSRKLGAALFILLCILSQVGSASEMGGLRMVIHAGDVDRGGSVIQLNLNEFEVRA